MGEAEDIVLRELAQKKHAEDMRLAQTIRSFVQQIEQYIPHVLRQLRDRTYPDTLLYRRKVLEVAGEQRIGWKVYGNGYDNTDDAFILSDGTFYITKPGQNQGLTDANGLAREFWFSGQQKHVLETMKAMAEGS